MSAMHELENPGWRVRTPEEAQRALEQYVADWETAKAAAGATQKLATKCLMMRGQLLGAAQMAHRLGKVGDHQAHRFQKLAMVESAVLWKVWPSGTTPGYALRDEQHIREVLISLVADAADARGACDRQATPELQRKAYQVWVLRHASTLASIVMAHRCGALSDVGYNDLRQHVMQSATPTVITPPPMT